MGLSPKQKVVAGRLRARHTVKYMGAMIMKCIVIDGTGKVPTVGITAHGFIIWNYDWVEGLSVDEVAGLWVHEVLHLFLQHAHRRGKREHQRFNVAADRAINPMVRQMGLALPDGGCWPSDLKLKEGLTADAYYAAAASEKLPESWGGRCGSGAGGVPLPCEPSASAPEARSEAELHRACCAVAKAVQAGAGGGGHGHGSIPAGLLLAAGELLKPPTIPWEEQLRSACRGAVAYKMGAFDYRYDFPSRRQAGVGYGWGKPVLPRMRCPVPEVAVVVDTSGSMGRDELTQAVAESGGVMRSVGAPVTFMTCDADVQGVQRIQDPLKIELKGGGGTSFVPAFEAVAALRPRPTIVVFITDGCGDAPSSPPHGLEVIWVLVGRCRCRPYATGGGEIEWGRFIEVGEGEVEVEV